jgi:LacI family transcriptional regulator, galactose operon repressor
VTSDVQPNAAGAASPGQDRRPTIYDVARLAEVNPSTVSRALSNPGRVSAKTEKRVLEAARTLNFQVNPAARALQTGRTSNIGLLVADITNPVFFNLARGAERAAAQRGYTLVIAESQESGSREGEAAERMLRAVDGIVLVSSRLSDEEILSLSRRTPVVVLNRVVEGVPGTVPDIATGIDQAVAHLASLGHRRVAHLPGPERSWMTAARRAALHESAGRRGMDVHVLAARDPTRAGGAASLPSLLASGDTAVMTYNDLMAIGLLAACGEAGIHVPRRLSIIGFDDIFGSDFTSPTLTTIRTPLDRMGENAVLNILDRLAGTAEPEPAGELETQLVIRRSTGPAG